MNPKLNVAIRIFVFAIVLSPFFGWVALQFVLPVGYMEEQQCASGNTDCRIDDLDLHTSP